MTKDKRPYFVNSDYEFICMISQMEKEHSYLLPFINKFIFIYAMHYK
jgi:hypothetical protein